MVRYDALVFSVRKLRRESAARSAGSDVEPRQAPVVLDLAVVDLGGTADS